MKAPCLSLQRPAHLVALAVAVALGAIPGRGQDPAPAAAPLLPAPPPTGASKFVAGSSLASFAKEFETETGIRLVPIPAGTFLMGSPAAEARRFPNEGPQTQVTLTKDFFLGATVVTQAQWTAVMGQNPSHFKGPALPVESVSWDDAMAFSQKLTEQERAAARLPAGHVLTLPTEAQWEYACRAGATVGDPGDMHVLAWFNENSEGTTHPVGTKPPNEWGLSDMHGNVWERCCWLFVSSSEEGRDEKFISSSPVPTTIFSTKDWTTFCFLSTVKEGQLE